MAKGALSQHRRCGRVPKEKNTLRGEVKKFEVVVKRALENMTLGLPKGMKSVSCMHVP